MEDIIDKTMRVIQGCKNRKQLEVANKYIDLAINEVERYYDTLEVYEGYGEDMANLHRLAYGVMYDTQQLVICYDQYDNK